MWWRIPAFVLFLLVGALCLLAQEKPDFPTPKVKADAPKVPASRMSKSERDAYLCQKYGCDRQVKTFREAVFAKDMLPFEIIYVSSVAFDAATTQNCITGRDCYEQNPVLGRSAAQRWTVGPILMLVSLYGTGKLREYGHGTIAKGILFSMSVVHDVLAIETIRDYSGNWRCRANNTCVYTH